MAIVFVVNSCIFDECIIALEKNAFCARMLVYNDLIDDENQRRPSADRNKKEMQEGKDLTTRRIKIIYRVLSAH